MTFDPSVARENPRASRGPLRVVVADDFSAMVPRLKSFIEALGGFEVVATATNGLDAWNVIRELQPDLAVLDFQMPGLTGVEIVNQVRSAGLPTRVVIVTLYDGPEIEACCLKAGASGFVSKQRLSSDLARVLIRVSQPELAQHTL